MVDRLQRACIAPGAEGEGEDPGGGGHAQGAGASANGAGAVVMATASSSSSSSLALALVGGGGAEAASIESELEGGRERGREAHESLWTLRVMKGRRKRRSRTSMIFFMIIVFKYIYYRGKESRNAKTSDLRKINIL